MAAVETTAFPEPRTIWFWNMAAAAAAWWWNSMFAAAAWCNAGW